MSHKSGSALILQEEVLESDKSGPKRPMTTSKLLDGRVVVEVELCVAF